MQIATPYIDLYNTNVVLINFVLIIYIFHNAGSKRLSYYIIIEVSPQWYLGVLIGELPDTTIKDM